MAAPQVFVRSFTGAILVLCLHQVLSSASHTGCAMEDPPVFLQLKRAQRVGLPISQQDKAHMEVLLESGKDFMAEKAGQMVQEASGMPVMVSYSCDGTPCKEVVDKSKVKQPLAKATQAEGGGSSHQRAVEKARSGSAGGALLCPLH